MKISLPKTLFVIFIITVLVSLFLVFNGPSINEFEQQSENSDASLIANSNTSAQVGSKQQEKHSSQNIEKKTYTLEERYLISRQYNNCRAELDAFDTRKAFIINETSRIIDSTTNFQEQRAAVLFANFSGLIDAQALVTKIKDINVAQIVENAEILEVQETAELEDLKGKTKDIARALQQTIQYFEQENIEEGWASFQEFSSLTGERGIVIETGGAREEKVYITKEHIVGVLLNQNKEEFFDEVLSNNGLSAVTLGNLISQRVQPEKLAFYIDRYGLKNEPYLSVDMQIKTPLQMAVETGNQALLELLLDNTQADTETVRKLKAEQQVDNLHSILFSPINQYLNSSYRFLPNTGRDKNDFVFDESASTLLSSLSKAGYPLLLVNKDDDFGVKRLQVLGHERVFVTDRELNAIKKLGIEIVIVDKINATQMSSLSTLNRSVLSGLGTELSDIKESIDRTKATCEILEEKWLESEPEAKYIRDTTGFREDELGFTEQLAYLGQISPVLADLYYNETFQREPTKADNEILELIQSINYLSDVTDAFVVHYRALDPDLYQQDKFLTHLCRLSGIEGVKLAVEINKNFDFYNEYNQCVSEQAEIRREIDNYMQTLFDAAGHSPGYATSLLRKGNIQLLVDRIRSGELVASTDLAGREHGRDALMYALDRFSDFRFQSMSLQHFSDEDMYQILLILLENTELNNEHLMRLHRLKVAKILLFERLSERVPAILEAVNYDFNEYKSALL